MQWVSDFQASLREPVFGLLSRIWPFLALLGLGLAGALLFADLRRTRGGAESSDADGGMAFDGDAGDGDGSD